MLPQLHVTIGEILWVAIAVVGLSINSLWALRKSLGNERIRRYRKRNGALRWITTGKIVRDIGRCCTQVFFIVAGVSQMFRENPPSQSDYRAVITVLCLFAASISIVILAIIDQVYAERAERELYDQENQDATAVPTD